VVPISKHRSVKFVFRALILTGLQPGDTRLLRVWQPFQRFRFGTLHWKPWKTVPLIIRS